MSLQQKSVSSEVAYWMNKYQTVLNEKNELAQ